MHHAVTVREHIEAHRASAYCCCWSPAADSCPLLISKLLCWRTCSLHPARLLPRSSVLVPMLGVLT